MTLPHEELRAVQLLKALARDILLARPALTRKELKERASSALRHAPYDCSLRQRWDDVCHECNDTLEFCKCEHNKTGA